MGIIVTGMPGAWAFVGCETGNTRSNSCQRIEEMLSVVIQFAHGRVEKPRPLIFRRAVTRRGLASPRWKRQVSMHGKTEVEWAYRARHRPCPRLQPEFESSLLSVPTRGDDTRDLFQRGRRTAAALWGFDSPRPHPNVLRGSSVVRIAGSCPEGRGFDSCPLNHDSRAAAGRARRDNEDYGSPATGTSPLPGRRPLFP